ncbi:hypothetical protein AALB39_17190 [Lachnospiraceae bacterium 54-53]
MKRNKKKLGVRLTVIAGLVLVAAFTLLLHVWEGKTEPLFDDNASTTFYAKTYVGTVPRLDAERYFSPETYDCTKFRFDFSQCDWNTAGIYRIPVLYEGEKTNCVVQIEVRALWQGGLEVIQEAGKNAGGTEGK